MASHPLLTGCVTLNESPAFSEPRVHQVLDGGHRMSSVSNVGSQGVSPLRIRERFVALEDFRNHIPNILTCRKYWRKNANHRASK